LATDKQANRWTAPLRKGALAIASGGLKSAGDCMRNANKSQKNSNLKKFQFRNGEENGKVIRNPYPGPEHHQKLNCYFD